MADRPILFSAPMICAILREIEKPGFGKTQTRRVLPFQPCDLDRPFMMADGSWHVTGSEGDHLSPLPVRIRSGDRLWVRETVACGACAPSKPSLWSPSFWRREQGSPSNPSGLWYEADGLSPERTITDRGRWTPYIHMPRWASRITLLVTGVRVERLQDISEEDAFDEGIETDAWDQGLAVRNYAKPDVWFCMWGGPEAYTEPGVYVPFEEIGRASYRTLWDAINGPGAWDANPWVAAYTFKPMLANIDSAQARGEAA